MYLRALNSNMLQAFLSCDQDALVRVQWLHEYDANMAVTSRHT
jgi:hypothetical protein